MVKDSFYALIKHGKIIRYFHWAVYRVGDQMLHQYLHVESDLYSESVYAHAHHLQYANDLCVVHTSKGNLIFLNGSIQDILFFNSTKIAWAAWRCSGQH